MIVGVALGEISDQTERNLNRIARCISRYILLCLTQRGVCLLGVLCAAD